MPGGCICNLVAMGPVVSEEKSFEIVDGRTTEPAYTISSPVAFGSGELKILVVERGGGGCVARVSDFFSKESEKKNFCFLFERVKVREDWLV